MHLIDGAGHVNNQFVPEDVATGRPPTEITTDFMNALQNEIANFILSAGVSLNKNSNTQLRDALTNTFARRDGTIHYVGQVWNIVANQQTLAEVPLPLPEGTKILVTSYYGPYQAAIVTMVAEAWIDTPTPLNVFDLYETTYDNHGYYWFSNTWNLFDVATMQVEEATEVEQGIIKLATWAEVLAGSLAAVALRPRHMKDYIDRMFVGAVEDFSGTNPPLVWVPAAGQLINRSERPLLWEFAQASGNIVADSEWSTNTGKYSTGNGTTTFRVPDLRGEFRRGWDNGRGVDVGRGIGTKQGDAFRTHWHYGNMVGTNAELKTGGASLCRGIAGQSVAGGPVPSKAQTTFEPGEGAGNETRPRNWAGLTCIYAGTPASS
ncbi:MAG: hypothetical protein FWH56_02240 [Betaproteobacteria bacterium]|nr:hypothetical protein [Betaproteobacteria bacterium]